MSDLRGVPRRDVLKVAGAVPLLLGAATWAAPRAAAGVAGSSVFLDLGHNGANDASINQPVPNGRGGSKPCQTSGPRPATAIPSTASTGPRLAEP